jgi:GntR family transcriptional regulator, arabinose operon transcriptional repressor
MNKHARVFALLRRDIDAGRWAVGERLPSEAELVRTFGVSRITVTRAVRDLQQLGFVQRRTGAGTFVAQRHAASAQSFGLLIPDLGETEIFEPICQGMMASPRALEHALIWGSAATQGDNKEERAWALCRQYIQRCVSGVFFAPLEVPAHQQDVNRRILRALDAARIPVVLLDRTIEAYPKMGEHDLVGIDNRRAGYFATEYLLGLGCRRVAFIGRLHGASTIDSRESGYRGALFAHGIAPDRGRACRIDPRDVSAVKDFIAAAKPDGIVAGNDLTAGQLLHSLHKLRLRVPQDVRLIGIDDVEYARLLPVPLTTLRQPTREIGDAAISVMLERTARPDIAPREVRLGCQLIVRESCGGKKA